VGIGERGAPGRAASPSHEQHGHVQEVMQNFMPKPGTACSTAAS
jgi:hypothetical protein